MLRKSNKISLFFIEGEILNQEIYEKIRNNPKFIELVSKRSKFAWKLAFIMLFVYYTFILVIAFSPETLGHPIGEGVATIGIPIGIVIIFLCFLLTGVYTKRANGEFDALTAQIKEDIRGEE
jgi:uncharacterized membrane protein (DUF485 family)